MKMALVIESVTARSQPYQYPSARNFFEPDWQRIPGFSDVTEPEWRDAQWQRKNTIRRIGQLRDVLGGLLPEALADDIALDQQERATMSIAVPPQMLNTMNLTDLWTDPIRRYMLPAFSDRDPEFPSHPIARRDSLYEAEMWVAEGMTHSIRPRYSPNS